MVNAGDDFQGYMQDIQKRELQAEQFTSQIENHEIWRQTTWGGFAVRQMQSLGTHFAPFFEALTDLMRDDQNAPGAVSFVVLIRVLAILGYLIAAYAATKIVQRLVGRDIIIEEEIIVIIQDDEDDDEDEKPSRRSARQKKAQ